MTQNTPQAPNGLVAVIDGGYESYAAEEALLAAAGYHLVVFQGGRHDLEGKLAFARNAVGLFARWSELDGKAFDALPSLRCVVRYGVGYDNVDLDAAAARGIKVSNVQGYADHSVSDHALALILACVRALPMAPQQFHDGFGQSPRAHLPELKDMTLGIVGLGHIGGTLSRKVQSLFKNVIACDPYILKARFEQCGARERTFEQLTAESDVVSAHCNLTDETREMFGRATFEKMADNAVFVNTARGPLVDEEALLDAIERGKLYAAGLDVFWDEPPRANRAALIAHPHVITTGHYAWFSTPAHQELQRHAAENMAAMLRGDIPADCLNANG